MKNIFMVNTFLTKSIHITVDFVSYFSLGLATASLWLSDFKENISQESIVTLVEKMPIGCTYAIVTLGLVFWVGKIFWLSYKSWWLDRAKQMEEIRAMKIDNDKREKENQKLIK